MGSWDQGICPLGQLETRLRCEGAKLPKGRANPHHKYAQDKRQNGENWEKGAKTSEGQGCEGPL